MIFPVYSSVPSQGTAHVEPVLATADQRAQLGGTVTQKCGSKDSAHIGATVEPQSAVVGNHGGAKARGARK